MLDEALDVAHVQRRIQPVEPRGPSQQPKTDFFTSFATDVAQPPGRDQKVVEGHAVILLRVVDIIQFASVFVGFAFEGSEELRGIDTVGRISINGTPNIQPPDALVLLELEIDESSVSPSAKVIIPRGQEVGPTHGHL